MFSDASKSCKQMNAVIASPNSLESFEDLHLFKAKKTESSIWLGYVRRGDKFINDLNEEFSQIKLYKEGYLKILELSILRLF